MDAVSGRYPCEVWTAVRFCVLSPWQTTKPSPGCQQNEARRLAQRNPITPCPARWSSAGTGTAPSETGGRAALPSPRTGALRFSRSCAAQECVQYPGRHADDHSIDRDRHGAEQAREQRRHRSHGCQYGKYCPGRTRISRPPEPATNQRQRQATRRRHGQRQPSIQLHRPRQATDQGGGGNTGRQPQQGKQAERKAARYRRHSSIIHPRPSCARRLRGGFCGAVKRAVATGRSLVKIRC